MTRDRNKKIWTIKYNVLNLPEQIEYMDGHIVQYTYAADGRKLMVKYMVSIISVIEQGSINGVGGSSNGVMGGGIIPFDPPGPIVPPGPTTYLTMDYCGNHVYRNGVMERTMNDYGYQADSTYYYYIKDYQGNVRAVIDQNGDLREIDNYYPYGGLMGAASAGIQPNKYGGKELDRENGIDLYDFEARYQDPMLPMFTTQDPLAEQSPNISPYAYCASNPIFFIDPTGNDWYSTEDSTVVWDKNVTSVETTPSRCTYIGASYEGIRVYEYDEIYDPEDPSGVGIKIVLGYDNGEEDDYDNMNWFQTVTDSSDGIYVDINRENGSYLYLSENDKQMLLEYAKENNYSSKVYFMDLPGRNKYKECQWDAELSLVEKGNDTPIITHTIEYGFTVKNQLPYANKIKYKGIPTKLHLEKFNDSK